MEKIALLLSGGVDSSVALYRLKEQGYNPDCFYIKIGPEEDTEWNCTSEEDLEMATALCRKFGCKLQVVARVDQLQQVIMPYVCRYIPLALILQPSLTCGKILIAGSVPT